MASQLYNNVSDALLNSIDNVQTSFDLVSGNIPAVDTGDYIPIYVLRSSDGAFEIMHVTGVSGSTVTVDRAEEDTSPLTFPSGDIVQIRPTRQSLSELDTSDTEVTTSTGTQSLDVALDDRATVASLSGYSSIQEVALTVNIPTDYATLQDAIDDLSTLSVKQGVIIDLLIETGHALTAGVLVENGDYGHFRISSVDAVVTLSSGFPSTDIIKGVNSYMPTLNCLIDANGRGTNGYHASEGSQGKVNPECGIDNCQQQGLYAIGGSRVFADHSYWRNSSQEVASYSGILSWGSVISALGADVSGSLYYGAQSAAGGFLNFRQGIADNCAHWGIRATTNGTTAAEQSSATGCGDAGYRAFAGGRVSAYLGDASDSLGIGFTAANGGSIDARDSTATNCAGSAYVASTNSSINAPNSNASGSNKGYVALGTSTINANDGNCSGCTSANIEVIDSSIMSASNANVSGCLGEIAVLVQRTSSCNLDGADITNSNAKAVSCQDVSSVTAMRTDFTGGGGLDVEIAGGSTASIIFATLSGNGTLPSTYNAISGNRGIIYN